MCGQQFTLVYTWYNPGLATQYIMGLWHNRWLLWHFSQAWYWTELYHEYITFHIFGSPDKYKLNAHEPLGDETEIFRKISVMPSFLVSPGHLHNRTIAFLVKGIQNKGSPSKYVNFDYNERTVMRPAYLHRGNKYTGRTSEYCERSLCHICVAKM